MTSYNIQDLFAQAAKEDLSNIGQDAYEDWRPEPGSEYTVVPTHLRFRETKAGMPSWGVRLKVTDGGADDGKSFWHNFSLTKDYPSINAEAFHYLGIFGLTQDVLAATPDLDNEQLDSVLATVARECKVTIKYRKPKKGTGEFPNHHYEAIESGYAVPAEDEDDDPDWLDV